MRIALTRAVSPRLAECELTHLQRCPIDVDRAVGQHHAYCAALTRLGCEVRRLPPTPDLPDGVFVEDTAVVFDEVAILARSAAESRREEVPTVAASLREYRPLVSITEPGTLDGGDVLCIDRTILVGLTPRTNEAAIEQMRDHLAPHGYVVKAIPVTGCLHLKSACTVVAPNLIVANPEWIDPALLLHDTRGVICIHVHPDEPRGANHLAVGNAVLSPASCPRTVESIRSCGLDGEVVDVSELELAESGITCSSLVFDIA
jgi:dimethylargininase